MIKITFVLAIFVIHEMTICRPRISFCSSSFNVLKFHTGPPGSLIQDFQVKPVGRPERTLLRACSPALDSAALLTHHKRLPDSARSGRLQVSSGLADLVVPMSFLHVVRTIFRSTPSAIKALVFEDGQG